MTNQNLSIIMPALNEELYLEEAIQDCLKAFDFYHIDGEIIVVNDGSNDNTQKIIENYILVDDRVKSVFHEKPMGIGFSFVDGVKHAKMKTVVMFPGDGENNPMDSLRFLSIMDQVDILVPFIHNNEMRNMRRRFISSIFRLIINLSFGIHLNYTNGTVFYNRLILQSITINSSGFFYQAEALIKLIRKGYLYAEVPNFLSPRYSGKSKAISFKSFFDVIFSFSLLYKEIHFGKSSKNRDYEKLNVESLSYKYIKKIRDKN